MSISLQMTKWLLKTMKVKESYDRPIEQIEEMKKKRNKKISFTFKPYKEQRTEMIAVCKREVIIIHNQNNQKGKALLYLYGGGFSSEINPIEKKASVQFGKYSERDVWIPRYPNIMDEGITIRELYIMVLETYKTMLKRYKPEDIAVIGFSAGATLGLGMFEYNNTLEHPLPVPSLLIVSSPACIPHTQEELDMVKQLDSKDIMIPASFAYSIKDSLCHGEELPSWMYEITTGDLSNMPFTHIYYGSDEVLRASCDLLTNAFEKAGSKYELHIKEGMFHCYPAIRFIPECREDFDQIVGYLRQ
ncbi:MAG: alpha/beta hydrolase fold domain-containing protein [Solobacterium sp.]|nr:alpha/beta hydrolase fold domain-containing protein [Solobacterium sp.]